jgi:hypothetical protein
MTTRRSRVIAAVNRRSPVKIAHYHHYRVRFPPLSAARIAFVRARPLSEMPTFQVESEGDDQSNEEKAIVLAARANCAARSSGIRT